MRRLQAGGIILLACFAALATPVSASLEGQVTNPRGAALASAKVTAIDSAGRSIFAISDADGKYRIPSIHAGVYTLRVRCAGYAEAVKSNVSVGAGSSLQLNFALQRTLGAKTPASAPLGEVSFYENSGLRPGQLKDPSAGGGYSDQAAIHSSTMVKQYLSNSPAPAANAKIYPGAGSASVRSEDAGPALLAKGDFARATHAFQSALSRDPRSARLETGLGIALYGQGKYDQAVAALCKAAQLSPSSPRAHLLLSEADRSSGHPNPEARRLLKLFVEDYPGSSKAHYAYGMDLWKDSNARVQARSELEKATALDPGDAKAHFQLGVMYDQEKLTPLAIREYKRTARLDPASAPAHYRLAQDYLRSGAAEKGEAELRAYEKLRHSKPDGGAPE